MFLYEPPEPVRTVRRIQDGAPIQRQERVIRYVSEGWIPANPQLVKQIEELLKQGAYQNDRSALIKQIKSDPGLFVRCLRELPTVSAEAAHSLPLAAISELPEPKLQELLAKANEQYTLHHFNKATLQQSLRVQHTLVSSLTSAELAQQAQLSDSAAFTSSMFQELGLNLVAWNYPSVYSDVMARHRRSGDDIESSFERLLGIAPQRIGRRFASEWGLSSQVREVLEHPNSAPSAGISIHEICRAAQLVADTFDEHNFPKAHEHLEALTTPLRALITPELIEHVRSNVLHIVQEYTLPKSAFRGHLTIGSELQSPESEVTKDELLQRNTYLLRCTQEVKLLFHPCYALAQSSTVSPQAIRALVDNVVPQLGFGAGCLYLTQEKGKLAPALCFGGRSLRDYEHFYLLLAGSVGGTLYSHAPLRTRSEGIAGEDAWLILASLENSRYEGVLYLEELPEVGDESSHNLLHFQVIRRALNQFLGDG